MQLHKQIKLFNHKFYLEAHPDLDNIFNRSARYNTAIEHYVNNGVRERRKANTFIDSYWYAQRYELKPDEDPLVHFDENQEKEDIYPNKHWEYLNKSLGRQLPKVSELSTNLSFKNKPTYILGLFGTGRWYINESILNSNLDISWYFHDGICYQSGGCPMIWSGHSTMIKDCAMQLGPSFTKSLIDLANANLVNIIFIYRHPIDSLLSNWIWWRRYLLPDHKDLITGNTNNTHDKIYEEINNNIYDLLAFMNGNVEFSIFKTGMEQRFFSLYEFICETERYLSNSQINSFRFEDFISEPAINLQRLLNIINPDCEIDPRYVNRPRSMENRYIMAMENVPAFKQIINTLPQIIIDKIHSLGYGI